MADIFSDSASASPATDSTGIVWGSIGLLWLRHTTHSFFLQGLVNICTAYAIYSFSLRFFRLIVLVVSTAALLISFHRILRYLYRRIRGHAHASGTADPQAARQVYPTFSVVASLLSQDQLNSFFPPHMPTQEVIAISMQLSTAFSNKAEEVRVKAGPAMSHRLAALRGYVIGTLYIRAAVAECLKRRSAFRSSNQKRKLNKAFAESKEVELERILTEDAAQLLQNHRNSKKIVEISAKFFASYFRDHLRRSATGYVVGADAIVNFSHRRRSSSSFGYLWLLEAPSRGWLST
jgi:hypothetical protein